MELNNFEQLNHGRKCEVTRRRWEYSAMKREKVAVDTKAEGVFHRWASNQSNKNGHAATVTVAIVELTDGTVITAMPAHMRFTSPLRRPQS